MKKLSLIAGILFSLFVLSSCANKNAVPQDSKNNSGINSGVQQQTLALKDYFIHPENTRYVYEGQGNEYASYTTYVDYIKGDRVQIRSNNGGTETVKVLENRDGKLTQLLARGETYFREDFTQSPSLSSTDSTNKGEILLKEPIAKGTTWTLPDNRKRTISNVEVDVTTPTGNYKAVEVTTEGNGGKTLDYYAPNVGLVKTVFTSNGSEVSSTLSKIENNVPLLQSVRFYYPNGNDGKLYFTNKKLSFNTNDITRQIFEKELKNPPQGNLGKVLGANAKINSLYLNPDNRVYIDLSQEFVSEMNAGAGYESMILQSVVNTVGGYYGVDKVYLTVNGNPYASGHIVMKKGEDFSVNLGNSVELK